MQGDQPRFLIWYLWWRAHLTSLTCIRHIFLLCKHVWPAQNLLQSIGKTVMKLVVIMLEKVMLFWESLGILFWSPLSITADISLGPCQPLPSPPSPPSPLTLTGTPPLPPLQKCLSSDCQTQPANNDLYLEILLTFFTIDCSPQEIFSYLSFSVLVSLMVLVL